MGSDGADDHYELLGIDPAADEAELRRAWKQLALRWHPDRAGPDVTFVFQKLLAAYNVLSDPASRAAYDRERATPIAGSRGRAPGILIRRLSRPLDVLLACGSARRVRDDLIELFLDEDEASSGGMVTIAMRVPVHDEMTGVLGEDLFAAWLAVPPGVTDGAVLTPSARLPGMRPVSFRVRRE